MGRDRLQNLGFWLVTVALEVGAGLTALKEAWLFVGVLAFAGLAVLAFAYFPIWKGKSKMIALVGMVACGLGFIGFGALHFWPTAAPPRKAEAKVDLPKENPNENYVVLTLLNTKDVAVNNVTVLVTKLDRSITYIPSSPSPDAKFFFPMVYSGGGPSLPMKLGVGRYQVDVFTQEGNFLERVRVLKRDKASKEIGVSYPILSDQEKERGVQIMPVPGMFAVIARVEEQMKNGDLMVAGTWLYNGNNNDLKYKTFQGFTIGPEGNIP